MAKYKVGDRVRIVSERPIDAAFADSMVPYLGKVLTVYDVSESVFRGTVYRFREARYGSRELAVVRLFGLKNDRWTFNEDWISGPAEEAPEEPLSVHIRFCGNVTVAELIKDGKVVKVENARRNPKDAYSRAEGARVAVERLFAKKDKPVKETTK